MNETTIFNQVRMLKQKGMNTGEAIAEIETILRAKLPDNLKDRIKTEMDFGSFSSSLTK